jgi:hypothetical protein
VNTSERDQNIELYGRGFELLSTALSPIPRPAWSFRPSPDAWSVHEVVVHLADSESMAALRARKIIVEPGTTLMGYDEAKWGSVLQYGEQSVDDALQIIRLVRQATYRLLKSIPEQTFRHAVTHPEQSGPYTLDTWLGIYARHIPDHIAQMEAAFKAWKQSEA